MACTLTVKKRNILAISNLFKSLNENKTLVASVPTYKESNLSTIEDQNASQKAYDKLYGYSDLCR